MIIGIGIDIVEIERIKKSVEKYGDKFLNKIFTPLEIQYALKKPNKYQHLAARFAAKEAVYKALRGAGKEKIWFINIEIENDKEGQPHVRLINIPDEVKINASNIQLSISHAHDYATSIAVIEKHSSNQK